MEVLFYSCLLAILNFRDADSRGIDEILSGMNGDEGDNNGFPSELDDDIEVMGDGVDLEDGGSVSQPLLGESNSSSGTAGKSPSPFASLKMGKSLLNSALKAPAKGSHGRNNADADGKHGEDEESEEDEVSGAVNFINQFFGVGDAIADDAEWLTLTFHDRDAGKVPICPSECYIVEDYSF